MKRNLGDRRRTIDRRIFDSLTHHVHILSMNGDSYRLAHSARRCKLNGTGNENRSAEEIVDPLAGEIPPT
jgi:hypothetical protein